MRKFIVISAVVTLLAGAMPAYAQDRSGLAIDVYLDAGWKELFRASGDLNKDGLDDLAVIIEAPEGTNEPHNACKDEDAWSQAPVRRLLTGFADGAGGLETLADDASLLLRSDQGGVMGDPLMDLRIERGALVIEYFGGSRFRWAITQRFRYEDDAFYLIGYTQDNIDSGTAGSVTYDYNLLASKLEITVEEPEDGDLAEQEPSCVFCRIGEACPEQNGCYAGMKRMKSGKQLFTVERKPLVRLSEFRCWEEETGMLKHAGFENGR